MRSILVANPKGGSGKTTLATHLAGYLASLGRQVVLADLDRQQSAAGWLKRRPAQLPTIHSHQHKQASKPDWMVIDSPAGLHGDKLSAAVKLAELVIVPVQPSAFDMMATSDFLRVLREEKAVRKERSQVAMVGMRVDPRTKSAAELAEFLLAVEFPVLTYLRDAQLYVQCAHEGVSLFDLPPSRAARDAEQWQPILEWISV
ncbi:cobyrinic acid a,c-diamide synthase [Sulfurimicrobium lacus]|uniref:Cobyrinic acid a,c-diamide synthase n=1 Tax=Sulfurimicrobium lacus TaxID=2715678 RepID=A0A6F8V678_9PROT|nr:ParA family protein [Sulfurimicrobium lacus]BCB25333.1 cobyrinic acid a,c-diamide synthase [Sulfurimicrobium lacus]